jgi:hypothetical protein
VHHGLALLAQPQWLPAREQALGLASLVRIERRRLERRGEARDADHLELWFARP